MNIEISIECEICGDGLHGEVSDSTIYLDPCENCMSNQYDSGHTDGYESGHINGVTETEEKYAEEIEGD